MALFYKTLANIVVGTHLLYVLFVVIGELLIIAGGIIGWKWVRNFWFRSCHIFAILFVAILTLLDKTCPLTIWEYRLRKLAGQQFDEIRFIPRLIRNILFWDLPQHIFFWVYLGFTFLIIGTLILIPPNYPYKK